MIGTGAIASARFLDQYAIQFNGTTQYAKVVNPSFKANTSGGISFWFKPTSLISGASASNEIFGYGNNDANNSFFDIRQRLQTTIHPTNNYIGLAIRTTNAGSVTLVLFTTTALTAGVWHHVTVQATGAAYTCKINNVAQTVTFLAGSYSGWLGNVSGTNHTMALGALWLANAPLLYLACTLNEIVYVNRVIAATEVTGLYNGGTTINPLRVLPQADMQLILRCGDAPDDATTMYDRSGLGNNFTLVNSPSYVTP